jgi:hypothetical protein
MKKTLLALAGLVALMVVAFGTLFAITGYQCCNTAAEHGALSSADHHPAGNESALDAPSDHLSFYAVELRCPLVRGLGCGTDSKPIMKSLDAEAAVAGTWLNHSGTTLAVLWNDGVEPGQRAELLARAFRDHDRPAELSGQSRESAFTDFRSGVAWYRAAAIDELSAQEADAIAVRWVDKMNAVMPMPRKFKEAMRARLSDEMRCRFVND